MSVRKRCQRVSCPYRDHRCLHAWVSELKVDNIRRQPVNIDDYACRRGGPAHVYGKKDAKDWEAKIKQDWKLGRDPRKPPVPTHAPQPAVVSASIVSADELRLLEQIRRLDATGRHYLQVFLDGAVARPKRGEL